MNKEQLEIQQIKLAYQKKCKRIKTIKMKPKRRDILTEAEYNNEDGRILSRESLKTEKK